MATDSTPVDPSREPECKRRDLLKTAALAGIASVVTGVPLVAYVAAPALPKGRGAWFDFGSVEALASAGVKMLPYKFMAKDGWMVLPRQGVVWAKTAADGRLTIFSSICPHLSCTVSWRDEARRFECPCHSAAFDADGRPITGPPTRPLAMLDHKVEGGKVLVLLPT